MEVFGGDWPFKGKGKSGCLEKKTSLARASFGWKWKVCWKGKERGEEGARRKEGLAEEDQRHLLLLNAGKGSTKYVMFATSINCL